MSSAQIALAGSPTFRIGRLFADPQAREVRFDRKSERLEPQPMKVLLALAGREGQVVSREDLISSCWDGRIVGEDVINRAILILRRVAKASGAFSIETVRGSGYRLTESGPSSWYTRRIIWSAVAAVAVAGVAFPIFRSGPDQSRPPLAVIEMAPFQVSGDGAVVRETATASDAVVADMLANSGLPVLKARTGASSGQTADLRLSGHFRTVGDHVEADLQLDDLTHGTLLLSRRFSASRDHASDLPERLGAFAGTSLATTGSLMALDRRRPGDRRLTGEVLRQWSNMILFEDPARSYQAVERIARQMPNSAVAQLSLAMSTSHVLSLLAPEDRAAALAKGRAAAARARELAPNYGDVASPDCTLYPGSRMAQCEASLRRAFSIDPDSPFIAATMRNHLVDVGRFREALDYDRLAVAAMPYMAGRLSASTMLLESLGQRARAAEQFQRVRRWWPEFEQAFALRFEGMLDRGSVEDAAAFVAGMPPDIDVIDRRTVASIASDLAAKRTRLLGVHCLSPAIDGSLSYFCLVALVRGGDLNDAFVLVDRLFPRSIADDPKEEDRLFLQRPERLGVGALSTPALAPLRRDRRFIPIAERVGLVRYWAASHLPDFCTLAHEPICGAIGGDRGKLGGAAGHR